MASSRAPLVVVSLLGMLLADIDIAQGREMKRLRSPGMHPRGHRFFSTPGFSMKAENLEMLQTQLAESSRSGSGKLMTAAQTDSLMVSLSGSVICKAAHSSWMHLKDVDLAVSDLTNSVELGLRPKLEISKDALDGLDKRLERPMKKSAQFVQKIQQNGDELDKLWKTKPAVKIKGRSRADAMVFVQKASLAAKDALAMVPELQKLLREGPAKTNQAMEKLMDFRENVDVLDTLDPIFEDDPPAKKK